MIYVPKYQDISVEEPIDIGGYGIGGEWRIKRYNVNGDMDLDTGWFPNLITNLGLTNLCAAPNALNYWTIGSSATAPAITDTNMGSFLKWISASTGIPIVRTVSGSPDYILAETRSQRWNAGVGENGTIRELGLGTNTTGGGLGVHTAVSPEVTKADDQVVDIFYRMRLYPDLIDRTGTVSISGTSYNFIARGSEYDANPNFITVINAGMYEGGYNFHTVYDGDIGASVITSPSGSSDISTTGLSPVKVSSGLGTRNYYAFWNVDDGNFGGGIRSCKTRTQFYGNTGGGTQVRFGNISGDTTIPKTNQQSLKLNFLITMTRH